MYFNVEPTPNNILHNRSSKQAAAQPGGQSPEATNQPIIILGAIAIRRQFQIKNCLKIYFEKILLKSFSYFRFCFSIFGGFFTGEQPGVQKIKRNVLIFKWL